MKALLTCVTAIGLAGSVMSTAVAETTLRGVTFIPANHPVMAQSREWAARINKALEGKLKINIIGGPEVVGRYQQFDAASKGVIDVLFAVFADIQDRAPATASWLSRCTIPQERETGYFDALDSELQKQYNLKLMARVQVGGFYLWVNKKATSLADLRGLKMRTGSLYDKMMQKLGMIPVTMNSPEVYTALERGVADGFGWPVLGPRQQGWIEKVKYVIDLPFFGNSNMGAMMNLDKWKALPDDVKKTIEEVSIKYEPDMVAYYKKLEADEWKKLEGNVTKIKFSESENKQYLDAAYETEWARLAQRLGAERVAELKKMTCN